MLAVDIDPGMARLAAEAAEGMSNVRVLNADALRGKNRLNPEVLDSLRLALASAPGRSFKLVANLPYNVATPIISNLLVHPDLRPERLVVTIQKELADRMVAPPDTGDYGALSATCQALADVSLVRVLPPSVFWPRPKVDSAIVMLIPNPSKREAVGDLGWFHSVVRRVFLHRRKVLRTVLSSLFRDRWTKPEIDSLLASLGLDGGIRAEAMDVDELIALAGALRERSSSEETEPDEE